MTADLDKLLDEELDHSRQGPTCSVRAIRGLMSDAEEAWLDDKLSQPHRYPHRTLTRVLRRKYGDDAIGKGAVGRHRRGDCSCPYE